jgi:hypothetical protein
VMAKLLAKSPNPKATFSFTGTTKPSFMISSLPELNGR